MRLNEFEILDEGGASGAARYNSEIAMLYVFTGGFEAGKKFDPMHPEKSIPADRLADPKKVYEGIKQFLPANYDSAKFASWTGVADVWKTKIEEKLGSLPKKFSWVAGENRAEDAADIGFVGSPCAGVSIKDKGGITLANLTPAAIGLDAGGDVIAHHAQKEFDILKKTVFNAVLDLAEQSPNKALSWHPEAKYHIAYDRKSRNFLIVGKGGGSKIQTVTFTRLEILSKLKTNADWQRPFGDWCVANFSHADVQKAAKPLIAKVSLDFEKIIENALTDSKKLSNVLRFAEKPYFYATAKSLYYVPSIKDAGDLRLKRVYFGKPNGWTLKFLSEIGRAESKENAIIEIHIRYANGMFACNPTVRVQSLKKPQFISWEKL